ncbi:MAG TPA: NADH-quinone oxidoreductase subunit L [Thermoanaerobaculia bacterium]|nr:NADH-quinone oxidoreductase subunit L [Thermoanaerobaculia bacterium]HUM29519.1 NADH-quinone oxidoreductase subunit L [Thermoanaerobaculia bacterium]HXK67902.1 NADH-quinone oxidoreductase subunit L [Thermoanaerobaculia bacterium]
MGPLWLIPALPLAGFLLNALFGARLGKRFVSWVGCGSVGLATLYALGVVVQYLTHFNGSTRTVEFFPWISLKGLHVSFAFQIDALSILMLGFVTFVGFLIHIYSIGYMHDDPGYSRFFAYLNLFMVAMLILILADNFLLMFVGWEGVGLCSYLLIGFFFKETWPADSGMKAFIVNRIGDFGFLLAIFTIMGAFGSLTFGEVFGKALAEPEVYAPVATIIGLCLFIGATGKSAQLPLYVWLPDAMAGPTPVSALIHAATMVTAGVYMVTRCNVIFRLSPTAMAVVAIVGGVTAFFAATMGVAQRDIKKILAYSTISQLGYMFLAAGVGAYVYAMFHVLTHAFFKACLFLGSGSMIHACHTNDIFEMGGLRKKMPTTFWTFMAATLAISGIPPFAGFFSKDGILASVFMAAKHSPWIFTLYGLGLAGAFITAFYMFRAVFVAFYGDYRGSAHPHESPRSMTIPLIVLGILSIVGGLIGIPGSLNRIEHYLDPVIPEIHGHIAHAGHLTHGEEIVLIFLSVAVALAGILTARALYLKDSDWTKVKGFVRRHPGIHSVVFHKYYVDEFYVMIIIRPFRKLADFCSFVIDTLLVDGTVNLTGFFVQLFGDILRFFQTGNVRNYALGLFMALVAVIWIFFLGG